MNLVSVIFLFFVQAAKPAPVPSMPAAAGVYFRQETGQWAKMETASMGDMKSKGMDDFLETAGYTNLAVTVTYKEARAKLQITIAHPTFYIRGTGSAKDAMVILLTRHKDSRTVRTDSSLATVDNRAGFRKDDIQPVTITVYSDDSYSVTPERDLKSGEYALVFGFANTAYDFGISRPTK